MYFFCSIIIILFFLPNSTHILKWHLITNLKLI